FQHTSTSSPAAVKIGSNPPTSISRSFQNAMLQPGMCSARSSLNRTCAGPPGAAATWRAPGPSPGGGTFGPPVPATAGASMPGAAVLARQAEPPPGNRRVPDPPVVRPREDAGAGHPAFECRSQLLGQKARLVALALGARFGVNADLSEHERPVAGEMVEPSEV